MSHEMKLVPIENVTNSIRTINKELILNSEIAEKPVDYVICITNGFSTNLYYSGEEIWSSDEEDKSFEDIKEAQKYFEQLIWTAINNIDSKTQVETKVEP